MKFWTSQFAPHEIYGQNTIRSGAYPLHFFLMSLIKNLKENTYKHNIVVHWPHEIKSNGFVKERSQIHMECLEIRWDKETSLEFFICSYFLRQNIDLSSICIHFLFSFYFLSHLIPLQTKIIIIVIKTSFRFFSTIIINYNILETSFCYLYAFY